MNRERIEALIVALRTATPPKGMAGFDMSRYRASRNQDGFLRDDPCGTIGCIAGWTCALAGIIPEDRGGIPRVARRLLGLDFGVAVNLFIPAPIPHDQYRDITPAQAADVLQHLLDTGEVDWGPVADQLASNPFATADEDELRERELDDMASD